MGDTSDKARRAKAAAARADKAKREAQVAKRTADKAAKAAASRKAAAQKRDRHTDPGYEKLLQDAEKRDWIVWRDDGYFKCLCPCADEHWVGVVLTPSGGRTFMNTRKKFERTPCWTQEKRGGKDGTQQ